MVAPARPMPHPDPEAARVRMTQDDVARHVRQPMYPGGPVAPERKEAGMPSDRQVRDASRWGPMGFLALAVLVVSGGVAYAIGKAGMPEVRVDAPDRYTRTDHIADQARLDRDNDKRDAQILALTKIVEKQDRMLERLTDQSTTLLALVAKQDDRIRALEEWQRSPRDPLK